MRWLFLSFLLFSCTTQPITQVKNDNKSYLYDLKFKVNDFWFIGFGLPQKKQDFKYRIEIIPPGNKIDRLIITTCHRQEVIDKPDNVGWLNKSVFYDYSNEGELESSRTCPMHIYALEEKTRTVGFGFIDFPDSRSEYDLALKSECNGKIDFFNGRGFCQSAQDLIQVLHFYDEVIVIPQSQRPECNVFYDVPQKRFEFRMPQGFCTYQFVSKYKLPNGKRHKIRFYTYGVTDVPVRF